MRLRLSIASVIPDPGRCRSSCVRTRAPMLPPHRSGIGSDMPFNPVHFGRSDLPMLILSVLYLLNSIAECVQGAKAAARSLQDGMVVCDLPNDVTQLAVLVLGTISSAGMLFYKISLCEQIRLHQTVKEGLKRQRATLLAQLNSNTPSSAAAVAVDSSRAHGSAAAAAAPLGAAAAAPSASQQAIDGDHAQFVGARAPAPPLAGHALADVEHAGASSGPPTVRGICDGCGQGVLSNDNGRVREGESYFHAHCVRGPCGGCGLVVHAAAGREKRGEVYWHAECVH